MRNKTKMMLLTALSLCTLSVGATAVVASAQTETFDKPLAVEYYGASIRYGMEDGRNGIRFAVRMEKDVFEYYQSSIETTYTVISDGVASAEIETTDTWYAADDKGVAIEVAGAGAHTYYQTMVYLWNIPDSAYAKEFTVKGYVKQYGVEEMVESTETKKASMEYVAKAAVDSGAVSADDLADYLPEYTVTYDVDGVQTSNTVKYGTVVEAMKMAGYDLTWTKDGEAFDFATPITEDTTLVATKTLKALTLKADSFMQAYGSTVTTYTDGKSYNTEVSGKTAMMYQSINPGWNEVTAQWRFDVTAEDIAAWQELGYEKVTFDVYAYNYGNPGTFRMDYYGETIEMSNGGWHTVTVDITTLSKSLTGFFVIYVGQAYAGEFRAAITQPVLVEKYQPQPITMADGCYIQGYVGADFVEKTGGKEYNVEVAGKTAIMKQTFDASGWLSSQVGQWRFNISAKDIAAWKEAGMTTLSFELYVSGNMASPYVTIFGKTVSLTQNGWTLVEIDFASFEANYNNLFQIFVSDGGSGSRATIAITQPVVS